MTTLNPGAAFSSNLPTPGALLNTPRALLWPYYAQTSSRTSAHPCPRACLSSADRPLHCSLPAVITRPDDQAAAAAASSNRLVSAGGQHGFLQSEQNLARSGLADANSQQQTVFAGKQESITAAGRGATLTVSSSSSSLQGRALLQRNRCHFSCGLCHPAAHKLSRCCELSSVSPCRCSTGADRCPGIGGQQCPKQRVLGLLLGPAQGSEGCAGHCCIPTALAESQRRKVQEQRGPVWLLLLPCTLLCSTAPCRGWSHQCCLMQPCMHVGWLDDGSCATQDTPLRCCLWVVQRLMPRHALPAPPL